MKVRGTLVGTPLSAKLTALCWGVLTLLVPVAVSACTSGTSTSTPTVFSPTETGGTASAHVTSGGTPASGVSPGSGASSPSTPVASPTTAAPVAPQATVTQTVTVAASAIPPAAPVTGGGGTAGFQDTLLLTLGAVAILAGAGGLIYRRWLGRGH
jgi:hypothetical protein